MQEADSTNCAFPVSCIQQANGCSVYLDIGRSGVVRDVKRSRVHSIDSARDVGLPWPFGEPDFFFRICALCKGPLMQGSFGLARGVLRMFTIMEWLMIVGAMAAMVLPWGRSDAAVLSIALVLLIYGVVMAFVSEMATAKLRTAENTAMLVADMLSLMEKSGSQAMVSMESLRDFQEQKGRANA